MTNEEINKIIVNDLSNKLYKIVINALELKGYKFTTKRKLYKFIKNNCRCEDYEQLQQKKFYVKEVPFLLYSYEITFDHLINNAITVKGGYYKCL